MSSSAATAMLTPLQNSHHFDERRLSLTDDQIKVGRAVARVRPLTDNAIFDCKVLSRAHATMWYEDGRFYLKDTKSSNGTFVNNSRLSKGSEESCPSEIHSGDIIQFGVEIVESTNKVTHGCIIAIVHLYHADGREAACTDARSRSSSVSSTGTIQPGAAGAQSVAQSDGAVAALSCRPHELAAVAAATGHVLMTQAELFQLHQYIKEAAYREQMLDKKLSVLSTAVESGLTAANDSWQALIDEDRLLSRIEMLQGQLEAYAKSVPEDKLREEMVQMYKDKEMYETKSKESIRRALEQKIEAVCKLSDVERSLETSVEKCTRAESDALAAKQQLELAHERHQQSVQQARLDADKCATEIKCLQESLSETEGRYLQAESEREKLAKQVESMQSAADDADDNHGGEEVTEKNVVQESAAAESSETPEQQIEKLKAELSERDAKISYLSAQRDKLTDSTHSDDGHCAAALLAELNEMISNNAGVEQIQNRLGEWASAAPAKASVESATTAAVAETAAGGEHDERLATAVRAQTDLHSQLALCNDQLESSTVRLAAADGELKALKSSVNNQHKAISDKDTLIAAAHRQLEELHGRLDEAMSNNERLHRFTNAGGGPDPLAVGDVPGAQLNTAALLAVLPFAMVLLAVVLCYMPFFASWTATSDKVDHVDGAAP